MFRLCMLRCTGIQEPPLNPCAQLICHSFKTNRNCPLLMRLCPSISIWTSQVKFGSHSARLSSALLISVCSQQLFFLAICTCPQMKTSCFQVFLDVPFRSFIHSASHARIRTALSLHKPMLYLYRFPTILFAGGNVMATSHSSSLYRSPNNQQLYYRNIAS